MKEYLLIFRNSMDGNTQEPTQEEMLAIMEKWKNWMGQLAQDGKLTAGEPLTQDGRFMQTKNQITDGPFAEGKEVVTGYLLLKASGYDEAIQLSKSCPIFDDPGTIEIREIAIMDM